MFSVEEKKLIAQAVEKVLLSFNHPEMPKEKPNFFLHVDGKESWSFTEIRPNWIYEEEKEKMGVNPWNEIARSVLKSEEK